jgi:hypothetical protein
MSSYKIRHLQTMLSLVVFAQLRIYAIIAGRLGFSFRALYRGEKTGQRGVVFGILYLSIGFGSSPPERMADKYSFLPKQTFMAALIAPTLGIPKHYRTEGFNLCGPNPARYARSFCLFRRAVKWRYLATDGIG